MGLNEDLGDRENIGNASVQAQHRREARCKGCYALGTACGRCSRCTDERRRLAEVVAGTDAQGQDTASKRRTYPVPSGLSVAAYCEEEVRRQGHDVRTLDGIERVGWMLNAWAIALRELRDSMAPDVDTIRRLGAWVEFEKNSNGFRRSGVRVGTTVVNVAPDEIVPRLERLLSMWSAMEPLELYREFELIHPFIDGNGRVGKILLNWRNGTLLTPVFPPQDFWGQTIANP